ncbi:MAG TPA: anion transporter [Vicinamibacterales bacterium]|jgi:Na+/H+ antiporter NhaD/arsenite permease-like protein
MPAPLSLSDAGTFAAYAIFLGSYFVFALGTFPGTKIDRPGAAIIGAVLMVAFRVVGARDALASVDFATIVLLFSMMLVVAHLRVVGFFDWITGRVIARLQPHHLLPVVIFSCGILSAFLVNDVVCLVMTPFVVQLARRLQLQPLPYLLAVATASNIGSVATITGNPQNMLIGSLSHISYVDFLTHLGPVAAMGLFLNWGVLHWFALPRGVDRVPVAAASAADARPHVVRWKPVAVLAGVLAGFLVGVPPAMTAAIGAAVLLVTRSVEPQHVYDGIDWGLLVFFVGLFIIVGGADRAGLTAHLLEPAARWNLHRLPVFAAVTTIVSNIVSNVPAVMLLRTVIPAFPNQHAAWLALAMASTLAGNLTLTGSVANIIVAQRAAADGVRISFGDYFRIGLPLTIATLAVGCVWLAVL